MAFAATMVAPQFGTTYTVNGRTYTPDVSGRFTLTVEADVGPLQALGVMTLPQIPARAGAAREYTGSTTDATPLTLATIPLAANSVTGGTLLVVARAADGSGAYYRFSATWQRGIGPGSATVKGTWWDHLVSGTTTGWGVAAEADTAAGAGRVIVTGAATQTVLWKATLTQVEV